MTKFLVSSFFPLLAGCASLSVEAPDADAMLADAKSRSAKFCISFKEGCDYRLSQSKEGWRVFIQPILYANDGTRVVAFDVDEMHFYDRRGRYKSSLRGL